MTAMTPKRLAVLLSILPLTAALALAPLGTAPALAGTFVDVTGTLGIEANALAQRKILPPLWGSTLAPYAPVYRYEEAWMLAALLDPTDHPFMVVAWPDVQPGYWALQAVNQVVGVGIMHDENGRFDGDRQIRRGEFVQALDQVLSYRAIPPPPPRDDTIFHFTDVHGALAGAADRAVNRWQFLSRSARFNPDALLTRGEAVAMLAKAAPLIDPTLAALMTPAATPGPTASPTVPGSSSGTAGAPASSASSASPIGSASPTGPASPTGSASPTGPASPTGSASPTSPAATDDLALPPIAWHWQAEPVLVTLGMADFLTDAFGFPGGLDLDLSGTSGPVVAKARAGFFSAGSLLQQGSPALYQVFGSGEGLFMMPLGNGLDGGIGGGVVLNSQGLNGGTASTANRTFFGLGPAGLLRADLGFARVEAGAQVQVGGIAGGSGGGGFGLGFQLQGHMPLGIGTLEGEAGVRGQLVSTGSGAYDFVSGLLAGVGGNF